ncbi:unnamed protein product [Effrenium voratum]|uniref:Uncharacterized protein n=1 Tax=Effrenium voratum TaxID=2562239 RepID=A0AA36IM13_9DINO|nr:unnamed protein product [Effrenium voratum]
MAPSHSWLRRTRRDFPEPGPEVAPELAIGCKGSLEDKPRPKKPGFKSPGLRVGQRRGVISRSEKPIALPTRGKVGKVPSAFSGWHRGRAAPEAKHGPVARKLQQALQQALDPGQLEAAPLQRALQSLARTAQQELAAGHLSKRETLQSIGVCQELVKQIAQLEWHARRLLKPLKAAKERTAASEQLLRQAAGLETSHRQLARSLALALTSLGLGRGPCCAEGHAMDAVPLPSLAAEQCGACGRLSARAGAEAWEPWWKCRTCFRQSFLVLYCAECGKDAQDASAEARLSNLAPAKQWPRLVRRLRARLAGKEEEEKYEEEDEEEEILYGECDMRNPSPDTSLDPCGSASGLSAPRMLNAPSPRAEDAELVFWEEGSFGPSAGIFLTQEQEHSSVASSASPLVPSVASSPEPEQLYPGLTLSARRSDIWKPRPVPTSAGTSRCATPATPMRTQTPKADVKALVLMTPEQKRQKDREKERVERQIITRRAKLPISPGLENVILDQNGELKRPKVPSRVKQRVTSARSETKRRAWPMTSPRTSCPVPTAPARADAPGQQHTQWRPRRCSMGLCRTWTSLFGRRLWATGRPGWQKEDLALRWPRDPRAKSKTSPWLRSARKVRPRRPLRSSGYRGRRRPCVRRSFALGGRQTGSARRPASLGWTRTK